jgi:hypothetical protein
VGGCSVWLLLGRNRSGFAPASRRAFINGTFPELASCWANRTLALGSVNTSRGPLAIADIEAPVAIAAADPVTAA